MGRNLRKILNENIPKGEIKRNLKKLITNKRFRYKNRK